MSSRKFTTPKTLAEAHETLGRQRPRLDEKPLVWVAFHRLCAEVYSEVSNTDKAHQHEALYWAGSSIRQAREIEENYNLVQDV